MFDISIIYRVANAVRLFAVRGVKAVLINSRTPLLRNPHTYQAVIPMLVFFTFSVMAHAAATHYVSLYGTNDTAGGYPNWVGAATNIELAVSAATAGDTVLVSNGTYYLTNEIAISTAITMTSVNGRGVTIVNGNNYPGKPVTNRCINIIVNSTNTVVDGFTILNGNATYAAGINFNAGTVRNSSIISNQSRSSGGVGGAGIYASSAKAIIYNCTIAYNVASNATANSSGGGIYSQGIISNCIISANQAWKGGGTAGQGGGVYLNGGIIYNSLIVGNYASTYGGGVDVGAVINCTIVSNCAQYGGGIYAASCLNSIVYFNTAPNGSNYYNVVMTNCCTAPTNDLNAGSINNIQSNPQFVSEDAGDWRLSKGSPCINAGTNESWMTGAVDLDLDGHRRIDRFSGIVDMGCYEYLPQGFMFSVP